MTPPARRSDLLLRARVVLPISAPPIADGAVWIVNQKIRAVGRWRELTATCRARSLDFGEAVLLPGLINAHCHLDYTDMAGYFPQQKLFTDWLKLITTTKAGWDRTDYAQSWLHGAQMLLRTGTTTVADIEAAPDLLPDAWNATPLRVISLFEMIGLTRRREPEAILKETLDRITALGATRSRAGLSPHAPWSTLPELMHRSAREARRRRFLLCTHVAESAAEFEMFTRGRGEMFHWLERSLRDMSDCGLGSPVEHLKRCRALGSNMLAVHVNYLGKRDALLLARHRAHVVHCPRSHLYFRHDAFPLRRLLKAGVNVCLGTDSLASVMQARRQKVELNMFEEMRALAAKQPRLPTRKILEMATLNGARALGLAGKIGQLSPGAFADIIALPFAGKIKEVGDSVLNHRDDVTCSMIAGRWAVAPERLLEKTASSGRNDRVLAATKASDA